ncbi:hypothetical protein JHK85_007017 [Glycine max]|nr:hypothetical protein JHK85_007017 [Glycine max]
MMKEFPNVGNDLKQWRCLSLLDDLLILLHKESIGNAVFFSVYEYVRYYMHSNIKAASSNYTNLVDIGIGIVSGGLGGVAVSMAGFKGCYTGLGPTVSRAFPANAATIVAWELALKMLGIKHD